MSASFYLENKTFKVIVDAAAKNADVLQTNISAFTPEQLDFAKSKNYFNETENTINWGHIADTSLKGKDWMEITGAIPSEFSDVLNNSASKSIFRQALGTDAPNEGNSTDEQSLSTSQPEDTTTSTPNSSSNPRYFFAYYPLAEVGGYDYLQVVCKEFRADTSLTSLTQQQEPVKDAAGDTAQKRAERTYGGVSQLQRATGRYGSGSITKGIVQLPMTGGLSETNSVTWGESQLNALQIAGARAAGNTIRTAAEGDGGAAISGLLDAVKGGIKDIGGIDRDTLVSYFAGQAIGVGGDLVTRGSGVTLNNNLELLFKGPSLRTFGYTYNFTPRGEAEAKMVKDIIWFFKKQMRPKLSSNQAFLKSPNVWKLKYMYKENGADTEHPFLNKIKMCALTACNVTYGGGQYMTYDDGSMTQYQMQLNFSELDPIYFDDYGTIPGTYNDDAWEVSL